MPADTYTKIINLNGGLLEWGDTKVLYQKNTEYIDTVTQIITVHDTIHMVSNLSDPDSLYGAWAGEIFEVPISLVFTPSSFSIYQAEFNGNFGLTNLKGRIVTLSNGIATVEWEPNHDASWQISITNGEMIIKETGEKMFPFANSITLYKEKL